MTLDEKLRRAYFWLVNTAVISPFYDLEFNDAATDAPLVFEFGDARAALTLPTDQSYSSNVLIPLLTFAVGGRCLILGGPGRGKTTLAVLMGVLSGASSADVRRWIQQGHPQLTVSDLVGMPLPKDLVEASALTDVRIAWRQWLTQPVRIVDEYNRIPTRTQSALLTLVAENYVESHDQMLRTTSPSGIAAWFFTANDDAGGGTYPVIEALRDRIDVSVAAQGLNSRFFDELVARVESGDQPEDHVPDELVFAPEEHAAMTAAIRAVPLPDAVRRRIEFFASHFEFVQNGGRRFERRTKDTVAVGGGRVEEVIDANTGADLLVDPGAQTRGAISVRALQAIILYAKAIAFFRGEPRVTIRDVAAVAPFVLRGKLHPNPLHPRFDSDADRPLALDTVSWLEDLFDQSERQFVQLELGDRDPVGDLLRQFRTGLDDVTDAEAARRVATIEALLRSRAAPGKLYGRDFDDLVALKYLHQRYTNYRRWLADRR